MAPAAPVSPCPQLTPSSLAVLRALAYCCARRRRRSPWVPPALAVPWDPEKAKKYLPKLVFFYHWFNCGNFFSIAKRNILVSYWLPFDAKIFSQQLPKIFFPEESLTCFPFAPGNPSIPGSPGTPLCPLFPERPMSPGYPGAPLSPGRPRGPSGPFKPLGPSFPKKPSKPRRPESP